MTFVLFISPLALKLTYPWILRTGCNQRSNRSQITMKPFLRLVFSIAYLLGPFLASSASLHAQNNAQHIAFAGLRATAGRGRFNGLQTDSSGNLYLLVDQKDGVRVIKSDPTATQILAQSHIGAAGDIGLALALDPAGNVYVTGTTTSASLPTTGGVPFPAPTDTSTNGFVAKFDGNLNLVFATYTGSGRMAPSAIAATADRVFITGGIYAATLPVTSSAIVQQPAAGSSGNGFVESFSATGSTLVYATYLSGFNGDTNPAAIAADASDNAYVGGYTTSPGFLTAAAVVPEMIGSGSGFLTKLTPAADGILFSTFMPGMGITSIALDAATQTLRFSGDMDLGSFPITLVSAPVVSARYQSVVRMPLDGSRVLASTLLAPGTQSVVTAGTDETAWAALQLSTPLLPIAAIASTGSAAGFHLTAQGAIDQSVRFGGPDTQFSSMPATVAAIALDLSGQPVFAGAINPTTSSSLLTTQTFDVPLLNSQSALLPSTVRDAVLPSGSGCGSLCAGSAALLTKLNLTARATLTLSTDTLPNVILRNLGSVFAANLQISASGFVVAHNCPSSLSAGAECDLMLTGTGPGTLTVQASNADTQVLSLPAPVRAATPLVYSPREIDFGILTPSSAASRTITVTNLGSAPVTQPISLSFPAGSNHTITTAGDCPGSVSSQPLQPGASCHMTVKASVPSGIATSGAWQSIWTSGVSSIALTGFSQPDTLIASATKIDFGTQFLAGLRLSRYLYLSNNMATSIQHSTVALPSSSAFTVGDHCPTVLEPHTVCQIQLDYQSARTSADSITLSLDQGLQILVTGKTTPTPGANGETANPNLVVTPAALTFPNPVVVTGSSANTMTATVSNTGVQPFPLSLSVNGDFIQSTSCGSVLPGSSSCSVVLTFTPSQPGTRQGLLSISSGSATTPAYVTLTGTGTPMLATNNGTLDLGSSVIGQPVVTWYRITQPFTQISAKTTGDFRAVLVEDIGYGHGQPASSAFTSSAVGSCLNCWVGIQFLPAAAGTQNGSLSFASSSSGVPYQLALTGEGLPLNGLVLTPGEQDFGPIAVHSSSAPALFTLTNLTAGSVSFTAPVISGDFTLLNAVSGGPSCIGTVAPGASCFVQVAFAPTATGQAAGTLSLPSSSGTATARLSGFGSPDSGLSINPAALIFGNVPSPSATQQTITLSNTGVYDLQFGSLTSSMAGFQTNTTCSMLTPGANCTIMVTFVPSSATASAVLSVPVTSSAAGSPQTTYSISLSGAYTAEDGGLQILPAQAAYGPTPIGALGITRQFIINNLTTKQVSLALALPRQYTLTAPPCSTLAPGAGCTFSLAFTPVTNGDITGTLYAAATPDDGSPVLHGLGYVEGYGSGDGALTVSGDLFPGRIVQFGQVASGQTATRTLTLTNSGTAPLTIRRITSEWPFLSSSTCGNSLSPGASCTVTMTYAPLNQVNASASPAPFNTDAGSLVIESDAASSPDFIDLTGTVTPMVVAVPSTTAPLSAYTLSQGSLNFGDTQAGESSAGQVLTFTNTGTTTLHIKGLIVPSDFSVAGVCPTIVPGADCSLTVSFAPQAVASQTIAQIFSALEIVSDSSTALDFVSLTGTATPSTLGLSPAALDFGSVLVGSSRTLPVTLTNYSRMAAVFRSITVADDYSSSGDCPASGSQLSPAAKCTLQITFKPSQQGVRGGAATIATSLTTLPLAVNLTGLGTQPHLLANPGSLSFGDVALGSSASLTFSLTNSGTAPVTGLSLAATGDYAIQSPCSSTTLATGGRCDLTIVFTPTAAGSRSGSLTITSSDSGSPITVSLSGNGLAPKSFSLIVDGGASSSLKVKSGQPAGYHLSVIPQNGYTGAVVLNCTAVQPGQYASCSFLPSVVTLSGDASQVSVATLNTVTESVAALPQHKTSTNWALLVFPLGLFFARRSKTVLAILVLSAVTVATSGCGSGGTVIFGDPSLRYTPPGTYEYRVTATGTTGTPISQTVTLKLVVTAQ